MFTCFNRLPLEIRQEVWKYASYHPRNIDIWTIYLGGPLGGWCPYLFHSHNAVPSLLNACRESRAVGLQHYQLRFGTRREVEAFKFETPAKIYVNPVVDRVCEMSDGVDRASDSFRCFLAECEKAGITSVALRLDAGVVDEWSISYIRRLFNKSTVFRELIYYVSRRNLNVKGAIQVMDVDDAEQRRVFERVQDVMQGTRREFEWYWDGTASDARMARPQALLVRFARIGVNGLF